MLSGSVRQTWLDMKRRLGIDKKNLSNLARPTWAKLLPLPFNYM